MTRGGWLVAAALVLAACGGDDDAPSTAPSSSDAPRSSTTAAATTTPSVTATTPTTPAASVARSTVPESSLAESTTAEAACDGAPGFDLSASLRPQFVDYLVDCGFTDDEAGCLYDNLDFGDPDVAGGQPQAMLAAFETCGISQERIVEIGGS